MLTSCPKKHDITTNTINIPTHRSSWLQLLNCSSIDMTGHSISDHLAILHCSNPLSFKSEENNVCQSFGELLVPLSSHGKLACIDRRPRLSVRGDPTLPLSCTLVKQGLISSGVQLRIRKWRFNSLC